MSPKKLKDVEFIGWQPMHSMKRNPDFWVYISPDNLKTALVNIKTGDVLFISDRATGEPLYTNPLTKKQARRFFAPRLI